MEKIESLTVSSKKFSVENITEICEIVRLFKKLSVKELCKTVCENYKWYTATGNLKIDACYRLFEQLSEKGAINMPIRRKMTKPKAYKDADIRITRQTKKQPVINKRLAEIEPVNLKLVKEEKLVRLFNEYINRYHYLGYKRPFGCYIKYFIQSGESILGCLLFGGAARALTNRDKWIGWNVNIRKQNLPWVIGNARFLILPWVKIKNLSSFILGQVAKKIREDWYEEWGYRPLLMETFVEPKKYKGTSYVAAGWENVGLTSGEGLQRKGKIYQTSPKIIYMKSLDKNFRKKLCQKPLERRKELWERK